MRAPAFAFALLLTGIIAVLAATRSDASDKSDLSDNAKTRNECRAELFQKLAAFPKTTALLDRNERILVATFPLKGSFGSAAFPAAATKIAGMLARYGTASTIPCDSLRQILADSSPAPFRYLAAPLEVQAKIHEKKLEVGSFVKLDKNGDFVTTHDTRTIASYDTAVSIRYIVADLKTRTIAFDLWAKDTLKAGMERGKRPKASGSAIVRIVEKIGAVLKTRFKK